MQKKYIMKISINGEIIDTDRIFKITPVIRGYFDDLDGYFIEDKGGNTEYCDYLYIFQIEFFDKRLIEIENKSQEKLIKFREDIIKVWSQNQSIIPQFNLD